MQRKLSKAAVLKELELGPSTAHELGAELLPELNDRDSMRLCSAWLSNLKGAGIVRVVGLQPNGKHRRQIYELVD